MERIKELEVFPRIDSQKLLNKINEMVGWINDTDKQLEAIEDSLIDLEKWTNEHEKIMRRKKEKKNGY